MTRHPDATGLGRRVASRGLRGLLAAELAGIAAVARAARAADASGGAGRIESARILGAAVGLGLVPLIWAIDRRLPLSPGVYTGALCAAVGLVAKAYSNRLANPSWS